MSIEERTEQPGREEPEEEFLQADDVGEIVADDDDGAAPQDDDGDDDDYEQYDDGQDNDEHFREDEGETIEVDLSNNSTTYFDLHGDSVYLIASHPKLPLVVSGGGDDTAYLWTTHTAPPRLAAKLEGHTESVVAGGFTADGQFLVTGDMSGQLRGYKAKAGGEKWEFMGAAQEVEEIVFITLHPVLPMIAVGASDGSVWIYEFDALASETGVSNSAVLTSHSMPATSAVFVPNSETRPKLVTISEDASIVLWDVYANQAVYTLGPAQLRGEHPWVSIALSPSGKTFAAGSMDGMLAIVKVEDGALLQLIDTTVARPGGTVSAATGPAASAGAQGDAPEGALDDDAKSVEGLAWSDKTNLVATGNVEGIVTLWDITTWRPRSSFQLGDSVTKLEFVKGTRFLMVSGMDGTLAQYDVISSERVWECQGHGKGVLGFALQNGGERVISAGDEGVSLIFDKPAA